MWSVISVCNLPGDCLVVSLATKDNQCHAWLSGDHYLLEGNKSPATAQHQTFHLQVFQQTSQDTTVTLDCWSMVWSVGRPGCAGNHLGSTEASFFPDDVKGSVLSSV